MSLEEELQLSESVDAFQQAFLERLNPSRNAGTGSLIQFFKGWHQLASHVRSGCELTFDEYQNLLTKREIIDRMIAEAPDSLKPRLRDLVKDDDAMFLDATFVNSRYVGPLDSN